ncbi:LamG-like jellyroll fold domain-containing protein [Paenibacillus sp. RC67]|uniref:LamG-like jellyroll fold domain-containing protein n=1 Tax=Paenibacillus sp. RC67 TaxID=3039392 RepID=UPI0024AC84D7|nr:LamG-like jellyroll fold domain-containing protein [Paenibacillus sp. RC67]
MPRIKLTLLASIFCFVAVFLLFIYDDYRVPQAYAVSNDTDLFDKQILYLPFESSTLDASGNGNNGTVKNTLTYTAGTIGDQAIDTTQGGYVNIADYNNSSSKFRFGAAQDFTVSFWMKANSSVIGTADATIVSNKDWSGGANQGWEIGVYNHYLTWNYKGANLARMDLHKSSLNNSSPIQLIVDDNQWHHIVVSHNRTGNATFYMDNVLKKTISIAGAGTIDPVTILNLNIGVDGKQNIPFKGQLDDFRIFTKALNNDEVQLLYNIKSTQNNNDAPSWPSNSSLTGTPVDPNGYQLTWPSATAHAAADSMGVTQYMVYKNNNLLATVDSSTNTYTAYGFATGELATFRVEAMDRLGNLTSNGPSISYRVPGIGLNFEQANLTVGETAVLEASVDSPSTILHWTIDNSSIGRIEPNGNKAVITGLAVGTANVTVTGGGVTATCKITVTASSVPDDSGKIFAYTTDDTFVQGNPGTGNYGSQSIINIKNSTTVDNYLRYGFLKYNLSGIKREDADNIESVKLKLYGAISDSRATDATLQDITAFGISDDSWNEGTLTYNNMPAMGDSIQTISFNNKLQWREYDITSYAKARLSANKLVSVALKEVGSDYTMNVYSKENTAGSYASYLEVTTKLKRPVDTLWPNGTQINIQRNADGGVLLSWPEAVDVLGVDKYRISMDGKVIATVPAASRQFSLKALRPGSTYTVDIEAGVTTGRWAAPILSTTYLVPGNIMAGTDEKADLLDYRFEQSATEDNSPGHHNGFSIGSAGVSYDPTFGKNVLSLDGSGSYVQVPHQLALSPEYMSIITSFSLEDLYSSQTIVAKNNQSDYVLQYNPITRKLEAWFYVWDMLGSAGAYIIVESTPTLEANKIYHAVATYDGLTAKLYLNGVEVGSQSRAGAIGGSTKVDLGIGASIDNAGRASGYLKGNIGLIQLYSKVFAAADVLTLYNTYLAGSKPEDVAAIQWDIPSEWTIGQAGQAVVKKKNAGGVESELQQGVVYKSLNPAVASISSSGLITPQSKGTAKLTAQYGMYNADVTITVKEPVAQYIVLEGPVELKTGTTDSLLTKVFYKEGTNEVLTSGVAYTSDQPKVATVDNQGVVHALEPGEAVLHAAWNGLQADWFVKVVPDKPVVDPSQPQMESLLFKGPSVLLVGETANTVVRAVYNDQSSIVLHRDVLYSSDNTDIAFIDSVTGAIYGAKTGIVTFKASYQGFNAQFSTVVKNQKDPEPPTEPDKQLQSLRLVGPKSVKAGEQASFTLEALYDDKTTVTVTNSAQWTATNPVILRVDAPGQFTGLQQGTTVVLATYQQLHTQASLTVITDTPSTEPSSKLQSLRLTGPQDVKAGEQAVYALEAVYDDATTISVTGSAQWTVADSSLLRLDGPGKLTGLKQGNTVLTATYENLKVQTSIAVRSEQGADHGDSGGDDSSGSSGSGSYGSGGSSGSGSSVSDANVSNGVMDLSETDVKQAVGNAAVSLGTDVSKVTLPVNAGELLGNQMLRLEQNGLVLQVPGKLLQTAPVDGVDDKNQARIAISLPIISGSLKDALIGRAEAFSNSKLNPVSPIYDFNIAVQSANGQDRPIAHWTEPVQVTLPVPANADKQLLGVYQLFADGSMKYIGVQWTDAGIQAELRESGKYAVLEYRKIYNDVPSAHWAFRSIQIMSAMHKAEGSTNHYFYPNQAITRAEFVALLVKSLNLPLETAAQFHDVPTDAWYSSYIGGAVTSGLVEGKDGNHFDPEATISREEMAVLLVRAYKHTAGKQELDREFKFADADRFAPWSLASVNRSAQLGLMEGREDGMFYPSDSATRAEAVQVLLRLLNQ